jgi:aminoglycoside 2''-phosphotransferase
MKPLVTQAGTLVRGRDSVMALNERLMQKQTAYLECIREAYPALAVQTVRLHDSDGQFNDILILNEEIIFRFPRHEQGVKRLAVETAILRSIRERVSLPVPNPIFRSLEMQTVGRTFLGYRMIAGELLRDEVLLAADGATLRKLAAQLATFLRELHAVPVEALGLALPVEDSRRQWSEMYARVREQLFPRMRPDARRGVTRHFESFLEEPRHFAYQPVLRHGDFGEGNVLFDPAIRTISGVIDFSSAGPGDPAVDVAALLCYAEPFRQQFYQVYPELETMVDRVQFYQGTFALQEALFGLHEGDREAFARGIGRYA